MKPHQPSAPAWRPLALAGLAGGGVGVGLYAALIEPRRLHVRRTTVHVRSLPPDLDGLRIALLSDFHAGRLTPPSLLRRAVRRTLDEQPHLIALTGDFVDRRADDLDRALEHVADLWAPLGVYAVPGNHDYVHAGLHAWQRALQDHPCIRDVTNRHVLIRHGEAVLCVAGVEDLEQGMPRIDLPAPAERDFTLLLAHNPDQAERTRREADDVDLILSGHTHGGQVRLPPLGALHRKSRIYDHGLRRRPWTQVYTTRGLGTTFLPLRFLAPPEVAILELSRQPRTRW
ncbi:MAG: metallophosphoesterase [Gemmatimonadota bacterium]